MFYNFNSLVCTEKLLAVVNLSLEKTLSVTDRHLQPSLIFAGKARCWAGKAFPKLNNIDLLG